MEGPRANLGSTYDSLRVAVHSIFKPSQAEQSISLFFQFFVTQVRSGIHMLTHFGQVSLRLSYTKV